MPFYQLSKRWHNFQSLTQCLIIGILFEKETYDRYAEPNIIGAKLFNNEFHSKNESKLKAQNSKSFIEPKNAFETSLTSRKYNTTERLKRARKKGINLKRKRKNKATHVVLCTILYGKKKTFGWSFRSFLFRKFALVCNYYTYTYMYEARILFFFFFLSSNCLTRKTS